MTARGDDLGQTQEGAGDPALNDPDAALRGGAVFLPRSTYRRRRVLDGLRLWPVFGVILLSLPVIWHGTERGNVPAMAYVFGSWAVLICGAAFLSWLTRRTGAGAPPTDGPAGTEAAPSAGRRGGGRA